MPLVNRSRARCSASYLGGSESSGGAKAPSAIVTDTSALLPWAARKRTFQNRRSGPRPCENVSTCRERRTSPLDCASAESIHTAHAPLKVLLENCIFHISPMYEFSHSLGQMQTFDRIDGVRLKPTSGAAPLRTDRRTRGASSAFRDRGDIAHANKGRCRTPEWQPGAAIS